MRPATLALTLVALASPALADEHFDEGRRLFPTAYLSQRADEIAELEARIARCPDLRLGPGFKSMGQGLLRMFNPPPATQPDIPAIRAWIKVERARRIAINSSYPPGPNCESLRDHYGLSKTVVERSGKVATPACAKDGTCADRSFIEIF